MPHDCFRKHIKVPAIFFRLDNPCCLLLQTSCTLCVTLTNFFRGCFPDASQAHTSPCILRCWVCLVTPFAAPFIERWQVCLKGLSVWWLQFRNALWQCCRPGKGAKASFAVENQVLVDADCDWIVLCPCGLDLVQTDKEVKAINEQPWWSDFLRLPIGLHTISL